MVNCLQVERMHDMYLETKDVEHSEIAFENFSNEYGKGICSGYEFLTYVEGKIMCSVHSVKVYEDDEGVTYLD